MDFRTSFISSLCFASISLSIFWMAPAVSMAWSGFIDRARTHSFCLETSSMSRLKSSVSGSLYFFILTMGRLRCETLNAVPFR